MSPIASDVDAVILRLLAALRRGAGRSPGLLLVMAGLLVGLALLATGVWLWSRFGLLIWLESAIALCL